MQHPHRFRQQICNFRGEQTRLLPTPFPRQTVQCAREIVRDFLYAARKLRFDTIPYNVAHRVVIHWAYYQGEREGWRRRRATQESERA